ncbi:MAG: sensor histidine kinase, partial [Verrucomicrobiota bacterium]
LLTRVDLAGRILLQATVRDITERVRLEQEVLAISERERQRIGNDLHDGLGQMLAGAGYMTNSLRMDLAKSSAPEAGQLRRIEEVIREAIAQTRSMAMDVHPVGPETNGLMAALEKLAKKTSEQFCIRCDFHCRHPVLFKDNQDATHLFRIAQEAVTNAIKHGSPKRIVITLTQTPVRLNLAIKDDGIGLPPQPPKKPGMGLSIMRYRAGIIGGSLTVQRGTAGGTIVECRVRLTSSSQREPKAAGHRPKK